MDVRLFVDGEEISLSKFVKKIFTGMVVGAVMSLKGIKENWKEIRVELENQT